MKVLWFEITVPSKYKNADAVLGGWQDSLEKIVSKGEDIELYIAFDTNDPKSERKKIGKVHYTPIITSSSIYEKFESLWTSIPMSTRVVEQAISVVNEVHPDIIHVFGTEWPYGLIASRVDCPVVLHIQGALVPYNNANFPPNYDLKSVLSTVPVFNLRRRIGLRLTYHKRRTNEVIEREVWRNVCYYMGRTEWDRRLSKIMHPNRHYYHVDEALRDDFINSKYEWQVPHNKKLFLISTGCGTFWKGPDMLLKTAKILKEQGVDFEWRVAGKMAEYVKVAVEKKEKSRFEDNNIVFVGQLGPDSLKEMLLTSTMYVHTAYIENSPNSICEAQYLGVPVVSTNVGGISSLLTDKIEGLLVSSNDPWQMACAILELANNKELMTKFSESSMIRARERHNPDIIYKQLILCYKSVIENYNN